MPASGQPAATHDARRCFTTFTSAIGNCCGLPQHRVPRLAEDPSQVFLALTVDRQAERIECRAPVSLMIAWRVSSTPLSPS